MKPRPVDPRFPPGQAVRLSAAGRDLFQNFRWKAPERGHVIETLERAPSHCVRVKWEGRDDFGLMARVYVEPVR